MLKICPHDMICIYLGIMNLFLSIHEIEENFHYVFDYSASKCEQHKKDPTILSFFKSEMTQP